MSRPTTGNAPKSLRLGWGGEAGHLQREHAAAVQLSRGDVVEEDGPLLGLESGVREVGAESEQFAVRVRDGVAVRKCAAARAEVQLQIPRPTKRAEG